MACKGASVDECQPVRLVALCWSWLPRSGTGRCWRLQKGTLVCLPEMALLDVERRRGRAQCRPACRTCLVQGAADGCCRHTIVKEKGLPAWTTSFATMLPTQRLRNQFHGSWLSRTESLFGMCNSTTVVVPTAGWVARGKRPCRYDTWAPRWSHGRAWSPHLAAPRVWDVATLWLAVLSSVTLPAPTAVGGRLCGALNASALPLETSFS